MHNCFVFHHLFYSTLDWVLKFMIILDSYVTTMYSCLLFGSELTDQCCKLAGKILGNDINSCLFND